MSAPDQARAAVMDRIRSALGVASLDRARRAAVTRRLERHPRGEKDRKNKWSHVDSNHGPPACEAGALTS